MKFFAMDRNIIILFLGILYIFKSYIVIDQLEVTRSVKAVNFLKILIHCGAFQRHFVRIFGPRSVSPNTKLNS